VSGVDVLDRFTWFKNSSFLYDGDKQVYLDPWGVPDNAPQADVMTSIATSGGVHNHGARMARERSQRAHDLAIERDRRGGITSVCRPFTLLNQGPVMTTVVGDVDHRADVEGNPARSG
jgi:hypothetical protein